jgi:hypothetical protein
MSTESKKKKGGWFTNLFFEEVPAGAENNEETAESEDITVSSSESDIVDGGGAMSSLNLQVGDGVFDQKFAELFERVIAENNIPGIDYFEFRNALQSNSAIAGLNESASFAVAFNGLRAGDPNLTKESLATSIDHYKKVLTEEEVEFNGELANKTKEEVEARRDKVKQLNSENEAHLNKIKELNELISSNQEEIITLNNEASVAEAKINQTEKNFIVTLTHVMSKLDTDKQKITELIPD